MADSDKKKKNAPVTPKTSFRVIPLGGLEEIGKNFTIIECGDDSIIIDCGIKFPDEQMYGVDFVIPDFSYLEERISSVRAIFLTHGHEDHIGSIPYFMKRFGTVPVYGTKLTIGLLKNKLEEHSLTKQASLNVVKYGTVVQVKGFNVEFVTTNHSIPDSSALYIRCEGGSIFHTGDFKVDLTPVDSQMIDLNRMAAIGAEGVDLLMSDSTNAEKAGYTPSERTVGESFRELFTLAGHKRIIIATFSTNVHRLQQIFDVAKQYKRKVAVTGRSLTNTIAVARELKYLKFSDNIMVELSAISGMPDDSLVILTTGSQGEPMSALSRMANGEHRIKITDNDFVIISATPIPGNEKTVASVTNSLVSLGAKVITSGTDIVHVSGHACQDELKLLLALLKPRNFMPVHGEYRMLNIHRDLATSVGVPEDHVFVMKNGDVLEIEGERAQITEHINVGVTLVDGAGIGDIGNIVLKDRKKLSTGGLFVVAAAVNSRGIVSGPDIISRGFIYMRESSALLGEAKELATELITTLVRSGADISTIKSEVKAALDVFLYDRTLRRPIVMPIILKSN
ncbi:MAG: ribonuclease J [Eubacteriaceae bacterium]|nr:ribonuclease J [Eubacteriaceae bacterium]